MKQVWMAFAVAWFLSACTTPPPVVHESAQEKIRRERNWGEHLSSDLESRIHLKNDKEIQVYLRALAEKLTLQTKELAESPIGVFLVDDRGKSWKDFALPGSRIYLSLSLLKVVDHEAELAAAVAIQLAHLAKQDALRRWEVLKGESGPRGAAGVTGRLTSYEEADPVSAEIPFFGAGGIFAFPLLDQESAVTEAVGILYRAGFDPRGMIVLLQRYEKNPSRSPYEEGTLKTLLDSARQAISGNSPLLNPIVRSDAFLRIEGRMRRL